MFGFLVGSVDQITSYCRSRLKIDHFAGRKFPTPKLWKGASLAADGGEPSVVFLRDWAERRPWPGSGRSSLLCSRRHHQLLYDDLSADSSRHGC
jgi:hypothetical protein